MIVTPIDIAIDKYINMHRAVSSNRTVEYYKDTLSMFLQYANSEGIEYVHEFSQDKFLSYLTTLRNRGIKNTSVNTYTRGIRAFANWCVSQDYIEKSFTEGVKKLRDDSDQIFPLTSKQAQEIDAYFGRLPFDDIYCHNMSNMNLRNYIIFHLMLDCGLRRQEVIKLDVDDVQHNCLVVRDSKYNKSRIVPIPEELHQYIEMYKLDTFANSSTSALLLSRNGDRLSADGIRKLFYNISHDTGIHVHPHMLRHTFATSYVAGGGNLEFLRIILGHASYNITQRYLHIAAQCTISDIDIYRLDSCFFRNYNK